VVGGWHSTQSVLGNQFIVEVNLEVALVQCNSDQSVDIHRNQFCWITTTIIPIVLGTHTNVKTSGARVEPDGRETGGVIVLTNVEDVSPMIPFVVVCRGRADPELNGEAIGDREGADLMSANNRMKCSP